MIPKGLVNKLATADKSEDVARVLQDPIINFSQHVVDQSIEENCKFQYDAGLRPTITRKLFGHGCDWCRSLAGTYNYHEEPHDIYRGHQRCRCKVEYFPKDGRGIQNSHTKAWREIQGRDKIEARKRLNLKTNLKPEEQAAIIRYVSPDSYILNDALRNGRELTTE